MNKKQWWGVSVVGVLLALGLAYVAAPQWFVAPLVAANRGMSGLSEHVRTVDGHELHYLDGGSGEVIVLLHGIFAEKDHWVEFARSLTADHRVVVLDIPGFGESGRRDDKRYTYADQVPRLDEFLRGLGLERVHLAGNSMGGAIAALYALEHPERVRSVAFIGGPHAVRSPKPSEMQRRIAAGEAPLVARTPEEFERMMDLLFVERPFVPRPILLDARDSALRDAPSNLRLWKQQQETPFPLEGRLAQLSVPLLTVWGDRDQVFDVSGAQRLRELLPNHTVRIMQSTGHLPMMERPRESARLYREFLSALPRVAPPAGG